MKRVLFVDDEVRILEGLRRMLRAMRNDWEMEFASGGQAALDMMAARSFDVIVSDMRMPEMDGATLLEQVRECYPEVVRIVLSGHTEMATALRVVPIAHQFLAKPCDPEMLRLAIDRACHLQALLNDSSVRRAVGALGDLPALPRTYDALTHALADPETSLHAIAGIVEQDVGISAKILQLANSSFFGTSQPVASIQTAIGYLGLNALRCLVLSLEIFRVFAPKKRIPGFSIEQLQRHAQLTAHIAARLPVPKHLTDVVLVSSMLHDVGQLIQAWKMPDKFAAVLLQAQEQHLPLDQVETRLYGFSHAEVGAYLLGIWGLPCPVVETVALHHAPNRVPHSEFDAIAAVYVADILARRAEPMHGCHPRAKPADGESAEPSENEQPKPKSFAPHEEDLAALGVLDQMPAWEAAIAELPEPLSETTNA